MDKDEFCEHISLYEKSMYYVAMSVVRNEADAGDVISEAIYRAYKSLPALKHKRFFKAWILRIVHNTAVEWIRKNARLVQMETIEENIEEQSVHDDLTMKVTLKEAVSALKQPYQTVVILFYYENLSVMEIAHITDASVMAVKKQLSRARKMLYKVLKEDCEI